jgi:hypothetical protein
VGRLPYPCQNEASIRWLTASKASQRTKRTTRPIEASQGVRLPENEDGNQGTEPIPTARRSFATGARMTTGRGRGRGRRRRKWGGGWRRRTGSNLSTKKMLRCVRRAYNSRFGVVCGLDCWASGLPARSGRTDC